MKIRSVHPSFFSDSKVCRLSAHGRLLFIGLWCYADDYGRGKWLPKTIEGEVFPRDVVNIADLLGEVVRAGLVRLFSDGEEDFFEIPSWSVYQSPKHLGKTDVPDPATLENPYETWPGQIGKKTGHISPELFQGEGVGEGEGEGVGEGVLASKPTRERNPIWDALAVVFGEPTTTSNRTLRGKVSRSLTSAGATYEEILERAGRWPHHFTDAELTETALEKHWDRLGRPPLKVTAGQVEAFEAEQARLVRERKVAELEEQVLADRRLG